MQVSVTSLFKKKSYTENTVACVVDCAECSMSVHLYVYPTLKKLYEVVATQTDP